MLLLCNDSQALIETRLHNTSLCCSRLGLLTRILATDTTHLTA